MKKILLLLLVCLVSCTHDPVKREGLIVKKRYIPSRIVIRHVGKMMYPSPVPEKYIICLQDSIGKIRNTQVCPEVYDMVEVGQFVKIEWLYGKQTGVEVSDGR